MPIAGDSGGGQLAHFEFPLLRMPERCAVIKKNHMRHLLSILLLAAMTSVSLGQKTKFVSRGAEGGGIEEYYVLKENRKVKHGTYVRYLPPFGTRDYVLMEVGSYSNGEKQGVWEYYYSNGFQKSSWNKLKEKGTYVNGKKNGLWTSYFRDTVVNISKVRSFGDKRGIDSVNLSIEYGTSKVKQAGRYLNDQRVGEWVAFDFSNRLVQKYDFETGRLLYENSIKDSADYNLNRKPLFIGGLICLNEFLLNNCKFADVLIGNDSTYVTIAFTVNTNGTTEDLRIDRTGHSKALEREMLRLISSTDSNWLPAIENGQARNYEYKIRMDIIPYADNGQNRRFKSFFAILE